MDVPVRSEPWVADFSIDPENIEKDAFLVLDIIRTHWKKEDIRFKACGSGFVNKTCKAYVPGQGDAVVFRVYPTSGFSEVVDKGQEQLVTRCLNELELCPKLHCVFKNGVCFDFLEGETFDWENFTPLDDVSYAIRTARELAKYHSTQARDLAISKYGIKAENIMRNYIRDFGRIFPEHLRASGSGENNRFPTFETWTSEFEWALNQIEELHLPLVLCHNDPNPTNIIFDSGTGRPTIVDYDLTGFGYAVFDLACLLFAVSQGSNPAGPESPRRQPNYWKAVLRQYLEAERALDSTASQSCDVTDEEVDMLYAKVRIATLAVMLFYIILFLISSTFQSTPFGSPSFFLKLAGDVYTDQYLKHKEEIIMQGD